MKDALMKKLDTLRFAVAGAIHGSALVALASAAWAQESPAPPRGPWEMMHHWSWGGMWLMPLFMMACFALMIVVVVLLVRWLGIGNGGRSVSARTASDILDERYARGEIDREEYLQRKNDIAGT